MKVFRIKVNGDGCVSDMAHCQAEHWGYQIAGHKFDRKRFERLTGQKWERGVRRFRLVEVRSKKVGKRG